MKRNLRRVSFIVLTSCLVSCSEGDGSSGGGTTAGGDPTCAPGEHPLRDTGCARALSDACTRHVDAASCADEAPATFDPVTIRCAWTPVVALDGAESCVPGATSHRCFAYAEVQLPCKDPCTGGGWFSTLEGEPVLLQIPCGPTGRELQGPLFEEAPMQDPETYPARTCATNTNVEPRPLCACADAACDALQ